MGETGLGRARLEGELERTWRQILLFARLIETGAHYEATIDTADPDARPVPRADLRRMMVPIGPVLVFAASNFPFAFSVAGGDTASALAAGCPVICKAHPGHPGTSELVGHEISQALEDAGLDAGTFSLVQTESIQTALELVGDDAIEAVAFTGSTGAGRAIFDAAGARERPIPVFAEMGSTNPVVVTGSALEDRGRLDRDGAGRGDHARRGTTVHEARSDHGPATTPPTSSAIRCGKPYWPRTPA